MKEKFPIHSAQFFTATIYEFKPALDEDIYKDIIIDSLQFLVREKRIELNAFAPIAIRVSNHLHLIWQPLPGFSSSTNQASFMTYTAQQVLRSLLENNSELHAASR